MVVIGQSGCIRAEVVVVGESGCIRPKCGYIRGKVVVLGHGSFI